MNGATFYSALGASVDDDDELDPDDDGDDGTTDALALKKKRRRGLAAMDLPAIHHSIASLACHIYSVRTVTGNPFPTQIRLDGDTPQNPRDMLAASSWCEAVQLIFGQNQIVDGTSLVPSLAEINEASDIIRYWIC